MAGTVFALEVQLHHRTDRPVERCSMNLVYPMSQSTKLCIVFETELF